MPNKSNNQATNKKSQQAEILRLQGNQAFEAKRWEEALELYEKSNSFNETAKCFSNIAAVLCKLGKYEEASKAAARGTTLDPKWAKGWWRRGLVCELRKNLLEAIKHYSKAVKIDSKDKTFKKSLRDAEKRANVKYRTEDGTRISEPTSGGSLDLSPAARAWIQVNERLGGSNCHFLNIKEAYDAQNEIYPSSEQWLFSGMNQWIWGMKSAIALLSLAVSEKARQDHLQINMMMQQVLMIGPCVQEMKWDAMDEALGGVPRNGLELCNLTSAVAHLGGRHLFFETANPQKARDEYICAPPQCLGSLHGYQYIALLHCVEQQVLELFRFLGPTMKFSEGLLDASKTFYANLPGKPPYPHTFNQLDQDPSPQEIVDYMKQLLGEGIMAWDDNIHSSVCLRKYASAHYRGNFLVGLLYAIFGQFAIAHKYMKWANDFIKLADEEFGVSKEKDYDLKGSAFRPSLRVGLLMLFYEVHRTLMGDDISGPYSMKQALALCVEISDMASRVDLDDLDPEDLGSEYRRIELDAFLRRRPLALAHSEIAAGLNKLAVCVDLEFFKMIAISHGFIDDLDAPCDPFGLVAEHYHVAAKNELHDAESCAIYWWGYAGSMAKANLTSGFTLGDLRVAIEMAEVAEEARDVSLFGENLQRGGSFENLAKLICIHFEGEPDSFLLPTARIVHGDGDQKMVCIGDNVICENFHKFSAADMRYKEAKWPASVPDTSELEQEHGQEIKAEVPTLETLCIRKLHDTGCTFAEGETDADAIHRKAIAMTAESDEMAKLQPCL